MTTSLLLNAISSAVPRGWRTAGIVLMLAVLGLVVLRPLCQAMAAATDDGSAPACCASMESGTLLKADGPIASAKPDGGALAAAGAVLLLFTAVFPLLRAQAPARAFPPQPSYYERSARIRR